MVFLAVVVLVRAIAWDRWSGFTELDAGIEVLYLPAWVVLIACVFGRRWWLAGAAALICVAQVIYVAPELLASTPVPAAVRSEPTFRLFDANVDSSNRSMAGYITQLKAYHPDVITMEETQQYDYEQLEASGVFADLPYRYNFECCASRGIIIASRYPFTKPKQFDVEGLTYLTTSTLKLPHRTINFWVVHTTAPTAPSVSDWNQELDGIYKELQTVHPRPLLMVGDFNATWGNRGFRAILSTGVIDGAAARGDPFEFTWSQFLPVLPPIIRIDHVITGGAVTVTQIQTHEGPGSDHRDITAIVATASAKSAHAASG